MMSNAGWTSSIQVTIDIYGHPVSDRGQEEAVKTDAFLFGIQAAGMVLCEGLLLLA